MAKSDVSAIACVFYAAGKCRKGKSCPFSHEAAGRPGDSATRQQYNKPIVKTENWDPSYADRGRDVKRAAEHVPEKALVIKRRRTLSPLTSENGSQQLLRSNSGIQNWPLQWEAPAAGPSRFVHNLDAAHRDAPHDVATRYPSTGNDHERMYGNEVLPARPWAEGAQKKKLKWDPVSKGLVPADPPMSDSLLDRVQTTHNPDYPHLPPLEPYRPQNSDALGYNPGYTPSISLSARLEPAQPQIPSNSSTDLPYQVRSERYRSQLVARSISPHRLAARPITPPRPAEVSQPESAVQRPQSNDGPRSQEEGQSTEKTISADLIDLKYELPWGSKAEAVRQSILAHSNKVLEVIALETGTSVGASRNGTAIFITGPTDRADQAADKLSVHIRTLQPAWTPRIQRRSPAPKQASAALPSEQPNAAMPASLDKTSNGQHESNERSLAGLEQQESARIAGLSSERDHKENHATSAIARTVPKGPDSSTSLHNSQSEAFLRSLIQDRLVGGKSQLPAKPASAELPVRPTDHGLPDKPSQVPESAPMATVPSKSLPITLPTAPGTPETSANAQRAEVQRRSDADGSVGVSSSTSPLARSLAMIASPKQPSRTTSKQSEDLVTQAVQSQIVALQSNAPDSHNMRQELPMGFTEVDESAHEMPYNLSHVERQLSMPELPPTTRASSFSTHRIRLPDDQDARELIRALDNYRDGRDLFPFGRLYLDKLLRLVALEEGPLKYAMAEFERIIADAGQKGFT